MTLNGTSETNSWIAYIFFLGFSVRNCTMEIVILGADEMSRRRLFDERRVISRCAMTSDNRQHGIEGRDPLKRETIAGEPAVLLLSRPSACTILPAPASLPGEGGASAVGRPHPVHCRPSAGRGTDAPRPAFDAMIWSGTMIAPGLPEATATISGSSRSVGTGCKASERPRQERHATGS
jgi:hypothetical protein